MSDLIRRQDAIDALGEEPEIWNDTEEEWAYRNAWVEHISAIKSLPSADRPTGEVDAVAIYEKAEHDLEHNKITLGEFEKRIEPIKHLYYDRPTWEWVDENGKPATGLYSAYCSNCGKWSEYLTDYCGNCGAKMGGGE